MKKAIQRLFPVFLLCLALTLSGCQATPQGVEDAGAQRAMSQAEQMGAQATKSPYALVCQDDGRQIDVAFGEGSQQLVIRATAQVPQAETFYSYTLVPAKPDLDALHSIFFAQAQEVLEVEQVYTESSWKANLGNGAVGSLDINIEGYIAFEYSLDDGTVNETKNWDAAVSDNQMDSATAKAELDRIAQGLGLSGVTVDYYEDRANRRGVYFYPNYTPFDVAPVQDRGSDLGMEIAVFSPSRLTSISWMNFYTIEDAQPVETLLSLDEAVNIANQHIGSELQPLTSAPFTQVSLRVRYQRDVTEEDQWTARPVWYFSTDDTSFMLTADEAPEGATGRYTSSFAVDAQTGVLESRVTAVDEG
ncbi:MAG TPA: hypothetical protein IAA74_06230 [Candidatus Excrementavichristensenella intestinipullorum]|nr:hypothetical protein [Candidatus Excrementavichristensenella intestinipullorum]